MRADVWLRRLSPLAPLLAILLLVTGGCSDGADDAASGLSGTLTVFAAASLTESLESVAEAFNAANPGVDIEFNFQSSSALATQIEQGAPADVFASANLVQMQRLVEGGFIDGEPVTFARNLPVIVVPADNPAGITGVEDLAGDGAKLVLAAPDVPIGGYSLQIIDNLAADPAYGAAFKDAVLANVVSNEANVRAVLVKVELGEADAGIVYTTDALVSGDLVQTIEIPEAANIVADYPIGVVAGTENLEAAQAFIVFVLSSEGQAILTGAGFDPAP